MNSGGRLPGACTLDCYTILAHTIEKMTQRPREVSERESSIMSNALSEKFR